MNKIKTSIAILALLASHCLQGQNSAFVNPFIGASTSVGAAGIYHGLGKTFPGAVTPFGMVSVSPETITGGDNAPGYSYEHKTIEGFAMTHLSGTGWYGDMGNFMVMPTSGQLIFSAGKEGGEKGWRSYYDKSSERATAGYYSVLLSDYGIKVECTAAPHCGMLRFTYSDNIQPRLLVDLARRIGGSATEEYVRVLGRNSIEGWIRCEPKTGGWGHGAGNVSYTLYYYATFNCPFSSFGFWDNGVRTIGKKRSLQGSDIGFFADFDNRALEMKIGLSYVDREGALRNYNSEVKDKDFDTVHSEAVSSWDKALDVINIDCEDKDTKTVFYTSLYHTMIDPRIVSDVDGRYCSADGVHKYSGFNKRTVFSGWDVFRSQFPLQTIINPTLVSDMINSLVTLAGDSGRGYLERWELLNAYSGCMIGNPAIPVIADAYVKGIKGYDAEKAYDCCKKTSEMFQGSRKSISETLEYSYSDWCLSRFADALGHSEDASKYYQKSLRYRELFNKDIKWFQPKNDDGSWMLYPRDGRLTQDFGCVESNPYQQGWFVPHDWDYFVELLGGKEATCKDLEAMFAKTPHTYLWNDYYNHANEPVHSLPYLFNLLGYPSYTQYWTRDICENAYHNFVEGLVGNEDEGQMSAWYVLSSIGLYQVCPGNPVFEITSPMFRKVRINLPNGNVFEVDALNNSSANRHIESAMWNGKPLSSMEITYAQIMAGGRLDLQMKL